MNVGALLNSDEENVLSEKEEGEDEGEKVVHVPKFQPTVSFTRMRQFLRSEAKRSKEGVQFRKDSIFTMTQALDHFLAVLLQIASNICAARQANNHTPQKEPTSKVKKEPLKPKHNQHQQRKKKIKKEEKTQKKEEETEEELEEKAEENKRIALVDLQLSLKILGIDSVFQVSQRFNSDKQIPTMNRYFLE